MPIKTNIIKGWITSIIGIVTMGITLYLVFTKAIDFVWEGIAGLGMGAILFIAPRTIERAIIDFIKAWGGKNNSGADEPSIKDEPK